MLGDRMTQHTAKRFSTALRRVLCDCGGTDDYCILQQKKKLIKQGFGWAKTVGQIRQTMVGGIERVDQMFVLTMAAYNLTRMRTLGKIGLQEQ